MDDTLKNLLSSEVLSEEVKTSLSEAWNKKLEEAKSEAREQITEELRLEFSQLYAKDKSELVEAADRLITNKLSEEMNEFANEMKGLKEEKVRLSQAIKETKRNARVEVKKNLDMFENFVVNNLKTEISEFAQDKQAVDAQRLKLAKLIAENKASYNKKLKENTQLIQKFILEQLKKEIVEFRAERRDLAEAKRNTTKALREHRVALNEQYGDRIKKLENFVIKQLTKEVAEFNEDKRQLVETRVKLLNEGKQKLNETRKQFISRAAQLIETNIEKSLKHEMTQFREDILASRNKHFGTRIFEAFAAEFMTSYLSEGTTTKKLMNQLNEANAKLEEAVNVAKQQNSLMEAQQRKLRVAEDNAERIGKMNQLLGPLSRDKKALMEELLENVRTENLERAFTKHLPAVLNEVSSSTRRETTRLVEEQQQTQQAPVNVSRISVTGDRKNRLAETQRAEESGSQTSELHEIIRLAGMKN